MSTIMDVELSDMQKLLLEKMEDHRAISDSLMNSFINEEGGLFGFWKFVSKNENLITCFRGNQDAIEIYYHNHVVWKLTQKKDKYCVSFNWGHAKGMSCEAELLDELIKKQGFTWVSKSDELKRKNIICVRDYFSENDVCEMWTVFKKAMDYCFSPDNGDPKIEKRWQQKFFKDFHKEEYLDGGLYIFDLEYQQKMPHLDEIKKIFPHMSEKEIRDGDEDLISTKFRKKIEPCSNEPDFMGVEFDEAGVGRYLVFGEIKSLYGSCGGPEGEAKSGINQHLRKMQGYLRMNELIKKRQEDAEAILRQYIQIGDISKSRCFDGLADGLEIKNVLVLTNSDYIPEGGSLSSWDDKGGAIGYYKDSSHRDMINELAQKAKCEIWLVNGCCGQENPITLNDIEIIGSIGMNEK